MNIEIFGGGERTLAAGRIFSQSELDIENVKIFPVPTTLDGERIVGTEKSLSDISEKINKDSFVIGYGFPKRIKEDFEGRGVRYYDGANDEDFLVENAYITAVGALRYALDTMQKIPRDTSFGIIGYGRIGSALFRLLSFFEARVRVFSRKKLTRIELGSHGIESSELIDENGVAADVSDIEMLFNTAPTDLSSLFPKKSLPSGTRVIDLASGDSFPGVVGVEYLPSLPGRMYPTSAGVAYARCAIRSLSFKNE